MSRERVLLMGRLALLLVLVAGYLARQVTYGTEDMDAASLFDYVLLKYPSGLGQQTEADDYLRDVYLARVRRDIGRHRRWLQTVRSADDRRYFEQYVVPLLKAGER